MLEDDDGDIMDIDDTIGGSSAPSSNTASGECEFALCYWAALNIACL